MKKKIHSWRLYCVSFGQCKLQFSSITLHAKVALKSQYLFVFGAKPSPANQNIKCDSPHYAIQIFHIFTGSVSGNWNVICTTGPMWGEPSVIGGFHSQSASDEDVWCFLWRQPKQTVEQTVERQENWKFDAHCKDHLINGKHWLTMAYSWNNFFNTGWMTIQIDVNTNRSQQCCIYLKVFFCLCLLGISYFLCGAVITFLKGFRYWWLANTCCGHLIEIYA